jgi:hypothetical protein
MLITLLVIVLAVLFCGWLYLTYAYPRIPTPWNWIILVIGIIIVVYAILTRFVL